MTDSGVEIDEENTEAAKSDGLIGNRSVRTFIIGGLLIEINFLAVYYFINSSLPDVGWQYLLSGITAAILCISVILLTLLHCCKQDGGIETVVGWVVFICGIIQIVVVCLGVINSIKIFGFFPALIVVAYAILPGCTAIFLGLDAIANFMGNERRRLLCNLIALSVACVAGVFGYLAFAILEDGYPAFTLICAGYSIIICASIAYLILNVCACCCDCTDNCCVRLLLSISLIVGAVAVGIGHFLVITYFGSVSDGVSAGGYFWALQAIFIIGLCVTWAIDMGLVDRNAGRSYDSSLPQAV